MGRLLYLQDGDVPGEALHRLVELPPFQTLLHRQLLEVLVELHRCSRGRREEGEERGEERRAWWGAGGRDGGDGGGTKRW